MPMEWMNENALTELFSNSTSVCYKCNKATLLQFLIEINFKFLFPLNLILYNFKTAPPSEVCYQHNTFFWLLIYLLAVTPLKNIKHWAVPNSAIWKTGHLLYSVKGMLFQEDIIPATFNIIHPVTNRLFHKGQ